MVPGLRATSHALSLRLNFSKFYVRTHVKVTRHWKSTQLSLFSELLYYHAFSMKVEKGINFSYTLLSFRL